MNFTTHSPLLLMVLLSATFILTLPFGAWRAKCRKFTVQWWLAIHLVIPFIFIMRRWGGFSYWYIPLFLTSTVLGQIVGGRINQAKAN